MTRDLNLLRRILLAVDGSDGPFNAAAICPDVDRPLLLYHVAQLHEAGYLETSNNSTTRETRITINGLTWKGHEFLDAIRPDARWQQIKERLQIDARAVPVYVVAQYAFQLSVQQAPVEELSTK